MFCSPALPPTPTIENSKGARRSASEGADEMSKRNFKGGPTKFCEDPDEIPNVILEGARRNLGRAPTKFHTKFQEAPDEIL